MFENDILLTMANHRAITKRLLLEESRNNRRYNRNQQQIK